MIEIIEVFQYEWAIRALLASSMVGIMCGILGCFIVLRNMALIGDALSHAILPGVVAGFLIAGHSILGFFVGSVVAGLIAAVLITLLQRNVKSKDDAAIGIVFTSMFALGVMGISYISRMEGVHIDMKDFLFGNVLGIADQDLWLTFLITLFVLVSVTVFYRYLFITTFQETIARTMGISVGVIHYFLMLLLSFAVVASLQSVGVILVVAMLIIPASTAYLLTNRLKRMLVIAAIAGWVSCVLGLVLAIVFETTPGPAMTITSALLYLLAVIMAPEKGLISKYRIKQSKRAKIMREDALKQMVKLHELGQLNLLNLQNRLDLGALKFRSVIQNLSRQGLISQEEDELNLTKTGLKTAYRLIRAHRLWETYLVERVGLSKEQIHEDAEKYEHILTPDLMDEMEVKLGNPQRDPHGSPIPKRKNEKQITLQMLEPRQMAVITTEQEDEDISLKLWQMGITPNMPFSITAADNGYMEIDLNNRTLKLDETLAGQVRVSVVGELYS